MTGFGYLLAVFQHPTPSYGRPTRMNGNYQSQAGWLTSTIVYELFDVLLDKNLAIDNYVMQPSLLAHHEIDLGLWRH